MARLIYADKIVNGIALYMAENAYLNDTPLDVLKMVANWITEAPPVDAVEVVRCKNCRFCKKHPTSDKVKMCTNEQQWVTECYPLVHDEDFCSYGERKDGDKL